MCKRFSFIASNEQLEAQFNLDLKQPLRQSYNISPMQHAYILCNDRPKQLQYVSWGLVPATANAGINKGKLANARMEGITSQPSFRIPFRERRCLVLSDSFYLWKQKGIKSFPYRINLRHQNILVMAGIWDVWEQQGEYMKTFSIITTPANDKLKEIDHRMPLILGTIEAQQNWLKDMPLNDTINMLRTYPSADLVSYRVTEKLNSLKYNHMDLHSEVPDIY